MAEAPSSSGLDGQHSGGNVRMSWNSLISAALLWLLPVTAHAAESLSAAGRIDNANTASSCSGVLVAPGMVATAAHCIREPSDGQNLTGITFIAGPPAKPVRVVRGFIHPLYNSDSPRSEWKLRFDLGLYLLSDMTAGSDIDLMDVGEDAVPGETLFLVSWRKPDGDRPRQRACPVLSVGMEGLVTLGCDVRGGESGAPVIRKTAEGTLALVAIISSRSQLLDQPVALATNIRLRLPPLIDLASASADP